jgi:uncharacterized protein with LGFP repeats
MTTMEAEMMEEASAAPEEAAAPAEAALVAADSADTAAPSDVAVVTPAAFEAMVEDAVASGDAPVQVAEDEDVVSKQFQFFWILFFADSVGSKRR